MFYEYLITLGDEVAVIWQRPWTATSVLLVSTRWVVVLTNVTGLVPAGPKVRLDSDPPHSKLPSADYVDYVDVSYVVLAR